MDKSFVFLLAIGCFVLFYIALRYLRIMHMDRGRFDPTLSGQLSYCIYLSDLLNWREEQGSFYFLTGKTKSLFEDSLGDFSKMIVEGMKTKKQFVLDGITLEQFLPLWKHMDLYQKDELRLLKGYLIRDLRNLLYPTREFSEMVKDAESGYVSMFEPEEELKKVADCLDFFVKIFGDDDIPEELVRIYDMTADHINKPILEEYLSRWHDPKSAEERCSLNMIYDLYEKLRPGGKLFEDIDIYLDKVLSRPIDVDLLPFISRPSVA